MPATKRLLVADECWVALARLHREHPDRSSFSAREILDRISKDAHSPVRPGIQAHIYLHNVANLAPNSARYRMFYRLADGSCRLFRPGDDFHPTRGGKTKPDRADLPEEYHDLLGWYEREYCTRRPDAKQDPVLAMLGIGRELWAKESGDEFIARERRGWDELPLPGDRPEPAEDVVWRRLLQHQGEEFHTATRLSFRYKVAGSGIFFYRDGRRINQRLSRSDFEKALRRCPLDKVTDVVNCRNPSYLFGLLQDRRIRGSDW